MLADRPLVLMEAMSDVPAALTDPDRTRDVTLDAIFTLHCRLLEALTVADFVLGKAYGLGRAMAEKDWLADLKTLLPATRPTR